MKTKELTKIGMLGAVAVVLMLFEVPLPFIAPPFYEMDLSEVPVLIGGFAMGPLAGVLVEFVKIVLNLIINGTQTAFVGETANFIIGCAFIVPASIFYRNRKSKKNAVLALLVGTICMVFVGCIINAYVLLPVYAKAFSMPIDAFVEMGAAINGNITNILTFVAFAVAPFNLIKGIIVSVIVLLIYKKISPILKRQ